MPDITPATPISASRAVESSEVSISLGSSEPINALSGWGEASLADGNNFSLSSDGYLAPVLTLSPAAPAPSRAEPTKKLSVAIPRSLHKTLKQLALDEDETMGELITQLLQSALDQNQNRATG